MLDPCSSSVKTALKPLYEVNRSHSTHKFAARTSCSFSYSLFTEYKENTYSVRTKFLHFLIARVQVQNFCRDHAAEFRSRLQNTSVLHPKVALYLEKNSALLVLNLAQCLYLSYSHWMCTIFLSLLSNYGLSIIVSNSFTARTLMHVKPPFFLWHIGLVCFVFSKVSAVLQSMFLKMPFRPDPGSVALQLDLLSYEMTYMHEQHRCHSWTWIPRKDAIVRVMCICMIDACSCGLKDLLMFKIGQLGKSLQ